MTINEIAKAAGVSIATVSRYLNNGPVKEETRQKIEEIMLEMHYVPSTFAKEIMNSQNQAIAILTHSMSNMYSSQFAEEVSKAYRERKIQCYTGCVTDAETEYRYLMDITSRKINGIILHEPAEGQAQIELYNRISMRIPLVMIHSFPAEDINCNSVTVDQKRGMKKSMEYLLSKGYRRIAYVSGTDGYSFTLKQTIWHDELQRAGISVREEDWIKAENTDFGSGIINTKEAVLRYLDDKNYPDAIFTANDIMAMGTLNALSERGIKVTDDMGLMSHDNTLLSQTLGLTCVDMKIKSVAITAMDLMEYAINGSDTTPRHVTITPEIIIRQSC